MSDTSKGPLVRVFVEIDEGMMERVVKDILNHTNIGGELTLSFVRTEESADLVIFRNTSRIHSPFEEKKIYVFFGRSSKLPENVIATGPAIYDGLVEAVNEAKRKFIPKA